MRQLGRYRLDTTLGAGAFATVWKGYDPQLETSVAIKVLAENWALDADVRERFLSEARLLRRIESPRVVRVHDIGTADERPFFVMDYITGGTVADLLGQAPPRAALLLGAEAAYAVHVLHEEGVVHRDIKPSNLLVDKTVRPPRVVVADLGSAKLLAGASGLTVTTGTPAYMAPEQADQLGGFDARADVYAVGAVTYHLLSGRLPFPGDSPTMVALRPAEAHPDLLAAELGLDPAVDEVLQAALDRDPEQRPATAAELGDLLTRLGSGAPSRRLAPRPAAGVPATTPARPQHPARSWRPAPVVLGCVVVFVLAAVATWLGLAL